MLFTGDRNADIAFSCLTGYLGDNENMSYFKQQVLAILSKSYYFCFVLKFVDETTKRTTNVCVYILRVIS